nr:MAG TPA: hypothetical protein [Caudoviricetes sp.]
MMREVEQLAADALLDRRLKINLPAPWLLRVLGKRTIPVWVRIPVGNSLIRMCKLFARMDIDAKRLTEGNFGTVLEYIGKHGVTASRMIAYGMLRGPLSSLLLCRPLAWYIREHMTMRDMADLTKIIVAMSTSEAFVDIILSVSMIDMLTPTTSQTKEDGS